MSTEPTPTPPEPAKLKTWICEATAKTCFTVEAATREEADRMAEEDENIDFRDAAFSCEVVGVETPDGEDDRIYFEKPSTPPDLSAVPLDVLSREIARREISGECVALIVTPCDLAEYWECDDAGATHPGSDEPNREEMRAIRKAFEVWQDVGGFSEIMNACRDAWNDAKAEGKVGSK